MAVSRDAANGGDIGRNGPSRGTANSSRPVVTAGLDRVYTRSFDPDHGGQITVHTQRTGHPGPPKPLWLRRHRATEHPDWHTAYTSTDPLGVPTSTNLHALATDLLDHPRHPIPTRHRPVSSPATSPATSSGPHNNTAWHLTRTDIIHWLDHHSSNYQHQQPVTYRDRLLGRLFTPGLPHLDGAHRPLTRHT